MKREPFEVYGAKHEIDEHATETIMRQACPQFFACTHGSRETYTVYRGQLIVRNTVYFERNRPERKNTVYAFLVDSGDLFCVSGGRDLSSVRDAKRYIDVLLERGAYFYDAIPIRR
jgi:hypothetical protein